MSARPARPALAPLALAALALLALLAPPAASQGTGADAQPADTAPPAVTPPATDGARKFPSEMKPEEVLEAAKHGPAGEDTPLPTPADIVKAIDKGVAYMISVQNQDGSWGSWDKPAHEFWSNPYTHKAWIAATTGLGLMSMLEHPANDKAMAAADRGLDYLLAAETSKRPSDWDVDNTWGYVYALDAFATALANPRYHDSPRAAKIRAKAAECIQSLSEYQTPSGGWGYYDFDTLADRPSWATSFETAAAIVALVGAKEQGLKLPDGMLEAAVKALQRARLANGAFDYNVEAIPYMGLEWINNVKGSLSRIQAGHYALLRAGATNLSHEQVLWGLDQFFEHHRFLDVARQKVVPHEAYYLNSGYFYYFGHFYAARLLQLLPEAERTRYASRLAREIVKTQAADGSMWDFYVNTYGPAYGTAFGVMTLTRTLPER